MLTPLLATLLLIPVFPLAQDNPPKEVLRLACERDPKAVDAIKILYSSDGKLLACDSKEGVMVWKMPTGNRAGTITKSGLLSGFTFSPDGSMVATVENTPEGQLLLLWDAKSLNWLRSVQVHIAASWADHRQWFLAFNEDGSRIGALTSEGVALFATSNLQRLDLFQYPMKPMTLTSHPDGRTMILTSSEKAELMVLYADFKTGMKRPPPFHETGLVDGLAISGNGAVIATTTLSGTPPKHKWTLRLWDSNKRTEIGSIPLYTVPVNYFPTHSFNAVQLSSDGGMVGCLCAEAEDPARRVLHLWNVKTQTSLWPEMTRGLKTNSFVFSPAGKSMATVDDAGISIWQLP